MTDELRASKKDRLIEDQPTAADSATTPIQPSGGFIFTYRNVLPVVFAVVLALFAASQLVFPRIRVPISAWELALGSLLALSGVALRLWCIRQIGGSARKTSKPKANRIISWGPYSLVRNPIYIANMGVVWGFTTLVAGVWGLPAAAPLLWLWYDAVVRREETFLEASHPGDYAEYVKVARRWIPSLRYRRRPEDVPPYPFRRALKRERGHIIAVSIGAVAAAAFRILLAAF